MNQVFIYREKNMNFGKKKILKNHLQ